MLNKQLGLAVVIATLLGLSACGGSDDRPDVTSPDAEQPVNDDADGDGVVNADDNCTDSANGDQTDSDRDGAGDACDPLPTQYTFENAEDESTVSYTGQTKRHILIEDLVWEMENLSEDPAADVVQDLNFYFRFDTATSEDLRPRFSIPAESLLPVDDSGEFTYGAIATGKDLVGKIAGGDGEGGGETGALINGEFFGWEEGMDSDPLPVELVDYLFSLLAAEATDNNSPEIATAKGRESLNTVTVDAYGRDFRQLIQKFLLGAVTFSQGTADYLQADFANMLELEDGQAYTAAEHDWDEAFGYFGAARDYGDYTDDEIKASGDDRRAQYENGYHDLNGDGPIDIRSEFNFGNSINCAKRDAGTVGNANPTNFTQTAFDAFIAGRQILRNAAEAGELTADAQAALDEQIIIAAQTWEKCVAATVVHYINDTLADVAEFDTANETYTDAAHFERLAKHWSEMKGFALGLQFNPESPFRADAESLNNLKQILTLMGDAPVLADGTQAGVAYSGSDGVAQYVEDLQKARDLLEVAYGFDSENVAGW